MGCGCGQTPQAGAGFGQAATSSSEQDKAKQPRGGPMAPGYFAGSAPEQQTVLVDAK